MQSNLLSNQNSKQLQEAQENLHEQVMIGFGFTWDQLVDKMVQVF